MAGNLIYIIKRIDLLESRCYKMVNLERELQMVKRFVYQDGGDFYEHADEAMEVLISTVSFPNPVKDGDMFGAKMARHWYNCFALQNGTEAIFPEG